MRFGQRWHFSFYIKIVKQIHFNKYFPKKTWLWSNFFWGDCAGEKLHFNKYLQKTLDFNQISFQVIVLERNRRVAKAYARAPVVTVNGSEEGFDGFRIGKEIMMIMNLQNFWSQIILELNWWETLESIKVGWCEAWGVKMFLYEETEQTASPKFPIQANTQQALVGQKFPIRWAIWGGP